VDDGAECRRQSRSECVVVAVAVTVEVAVAASCDDVLGERLCAVHRDCYFACL